MTSKDKDKDNGMRNFLVFEYASSTIIEDNRYTGRVERPNPVLLGYNCVGAVKALDEGQAVRAVMAQTQRISKYAVIPAAFFDFVSDIGEDPDSQPVLNP